MNAGDLALNGSRLRNQCPPSKKQAIPQESAYHPQFPPDLTRARFGGCTPSRFMIHESPKKTVFLETFGCQMNELDSELVTGQLSALGYAFCDDPDHADVLLYNTCSVREQAENKVLSRLGIAGLRKKSGERFVLGVIGCMAERIGAQMLTRFPQVDLLCGPAELDRLPSLIENAFKTEAVHRADRVALAGNTSRRSQTLLAATDNLELLDLSRAFDPSKGGHAGKSAYVRITRGCNKFCTYCVVPYTRGAEVHRPPDSVLDECKKLADAGVIEITLLGQTVNHYLYTHGTAVTVSGGEAPQVGPGAAAFTSSRKPLLSSQKTTTFADLLHRIHEEIPAIRRLRFVTSYPRDFGDDILSVMRDSPRICRYLHVPVQSGSDRILKLMNRGYTVSEYLDFIHRARAFLPDVCIGSDIIVGFPTESEEDFLATQQLVRAARHKNNFIFQYSPRPGTTAFDRLVDDIPAEEKRRRVNAMLAMQDEVSLAVHREWIGRTVDVFIESVELESPPAHASAHLNSNRVELAWESRASSADSQGTATHKSSLRITGRTPGDLIVSASIPPDRSPTPGDIIHIKIT
ncbi:MAG TPA: MiaB/RimO family radical SAM methylthiotransferase, partial [Phycisphaerales bacterium]|nr:MiaB/RimO family radical SAM methylthiotransferase [Phycisphaerales bacterium]